MSQRGGGEPKKCHVLFEWPLKECSVTYVAWGDSSLLGSGANLAVVDAVDAIVPLAANSAIDNGEIDDLKFARQIADGQVVVLAPSGVLADDSS
jgi:hypothetical protein